MILIVDIDHTLSDASWRDHLIPNWDSYHSSLYLDEPIREMVSLCKALKEAGWFLVAVTARPDKWRTQTEMWCAKHGLYFNRLLMRPDDDTSPSAQLKLDLVRKNFGELTIEEVIIMDDHDEVVSTFAALNYTVLKVYARRGT